jgi:hypothetical protein
MQPRTLYDKLWDAHVVHVEPDGTALIYIDRQLVHEVTSPQAFEGLKINGRKPWRLASLLATPDHNIPTADRDKGIADPVSRTQVETLDANCAEFGITEFGMNDPRQGIVHVIGPEQGFHPAGHDPGMRRFPYQHPRCLRRPGLRHRHLRGGARAGHPVPVAEEGQAPCRCGWRARSSLASPPRTSPWR